MNLKEVFRMQNKLGELMDVARNILADERNVLRTEITHLRSRVMPETADETVVEARPSEYAGRATELAAFLVAMLDEREKLAVAIRAAKSRLPIDMDTQVSLNAARQRTAALLRDMAAIRASEKLISGGGTGYRFNTDGEQVVYRCDARQVVTIDFDRARVRSLAVRLSRRADEVSAELDRCMVVTAVDYAAPFDVNDGFDEIFSAYIEKMGRGQ